MADTVRDNPALHRYEMDVDGETASLHYKLSPGVIDLVHTEVPKALGGRGVGSTLARAVLDDVRRRGLKVIATCPFVRGFFEKHPEYNDLVK